MLDGTKTVFQKKEINLNLRIVNIFNILFIYIYIYKNNGR